MSEQRSLAFMAACIRDCLPSARNEETRAGLDQAIKTLEWMQKGELVLKELMRLRKEDPELFEMLCNIIAAFRGAKIVEIREAA